MCRTVVQIQIHGAVEVSDGHTAVLACDRSAAIAPHNADVTVPRSDGERSLARNRNVQIRVHPVIACTVSVRIYSDKLAGNGNLGPGLPVPVVGFTLLFGADPLVNRDVDLIVVGGVDIDRATLVRNFQAPTGGKCLLHIVGVGVGVAPPGRVVSFDVKLVTNALPVHSRQ